MLGLYILWTTCPQIRDIHHQNLQEDPQETFPEVKQNITKRAIKRKLT